MEEARNEARLLVDQAKTKLAALPSGSTRDLLATLADTVISRRF